MKALCKCAFVNRGCIWIASVSREWNMFVWVHLLQLIKMVPRWNDQWSRTARRSCIRWISISIWSIVYPYCLKQGGCIRIVGLCGFLPLWKDMNGCTVQLYGSCNIQIAEAFKDLWVHSDCASSDPLKMERYSSLHAFLVCIIYIHQTKRI